MKRSILITVIVIGCSILAGCSGGQGQINNGGQTPVVNKVEPTPTDDKFVQTVAKLQAVLQKYRPGDAENNHRVYVESAELMEKVMQLEKAASATPEDIIGDNKNFHLRYLDEFTKDNITYRLVTFEPEAVERGAGTEIFVSSWGPSRPYSMQRLLGFPRSPKFGMMLAGMAGHNGNDDFLTFIVRYNGRVSGEEPVRPGNITLTTYRNNGTKWDYWDCYRGQAKLPWVSEVGPGYTIIEHEKAIPELGYSYDVAASKDSVLITLTKDGKKENDSVKLRFTGGNWIVE